MSPEIKDIFTTCKAALAPLAGISDSVYRRICVSFGACPVMTEMISSDGFIRSHGSDKTSRLLRFREKERPIGFQFFGSDPEIVAAAVEKALELKPDFIDLNAGCPVKKVIKRGCGSALLKNPRLLANIVKKMCGVSTVPISVKLRSGWDNQSINAVETAKLCEQAGAKAIIIHPRTMTQGFGGQADWSIIRAVKENISVPVIGSGDIKIASDVLKMISETNADYIMVGRAALGNPWIFREIEETLNENELTIATGYSEKLETALKQLFMLKEEISEIYAVLNMRKFFGWYSKGMPGGAEFRQKLFKVETVFAVEDIIHSFQNKLRDTEFAIPLS